MQIFIFSRRHDRLESPASNAGQTRPQSALTRLALLWGPPALYTALILVISLIPIGKTPAVWKHQDKIVHFAEYAILSALLFRAFLPGLGPVLAMAACIALSSFLGGAVEVLQPLFGRGADFLDFSANAAGSVAAAFLTALLYRIAGSRGGQGGARGSALDT